MSLSPKRRRGASTVEYVIVLGILALGAIAAVQRLGRSVNDGFDTAGATLGSELTTSSGRSGRGASGRGGSGSFGSTGEPEPEPGPDGVTTPRPPR